MFTPAKIYKKFLLKVNKNDTNTNVKVPKAVFVLLFNEQKRAWTDEATKVRESSDYIDDIEELLQPDVKLTKLKTYPTKVDFALPTNFFKEVSSFSLCSRGECKNIRLTDWFIKPKNLDVLLQNDNQSPSFDYRETLALLNNNKVSIYFNDFSVDEVFLTYYREPVDLDIKGYTNIDGTPSVDQMIDLEDINIEEIINRTAVEALRNYESTEQMQLQQQAQQLKEKLTT